MAAALYADGGGFLTADGAMRLAFGRAYGGSTVVYTGTSLVAPERVTSKWAVEGLEHADVVRRSGRYMEQNHVHLLSDAEINDNNRLFVEGCARVRPRRAEESGDGGPVRPAGRPLPAHAPRDRVHGQGDAGLCTDLLRRRCPARPCPVG